MMVAETKSKHRDRDKESSKDNFELPESQKYKLTLGIDREVIRRAKIADINISAVTERVLKIMTYKPTEIAVPFKDVVVTYHMFFNDMIKIMEKFSINEIEIGEHTTISSQTYRGEKEEKVKVVIALSPEGFLYHVLAKKDQRVQDYIIAGAYRWDVTGPSTFTESITEKNIIRLLNNPWLHPPEKVLENLLQRITGSSKINKEKIKEVKLTLRLLKTLFENGENNGGNKG